MLVGLYFVTDIDSYSSSSYRTEYSDHLLPVPKRAYKTLLSCQTEKNTTPGTLRLHPAQILFGTPTHPALLTLVVVPHCPAKIFGMEATSQPNTPPISVVSISRRNGHSVLTAASALVAASALAAGPSFLRSAAPRVPELGGGPPRPPPPCSRTTPRPSRHQAP